MLIINSHAFVDIPSRCAARDANVIMMRSKQDLASLSKDMSSVLVSRLIENIVCLKRDTSDVSRSRRDPPCSSPNAVSNSPWYIIRRPFLSNRTSGIQNVVPIHD